MKNIKKEDLNIPVQSREKEVMCRVIEVSDGSTRTKELIKPVPVKMVILIGKIVNIA